MWNNEQPERHMAIPPPPQKLSLEAELLALFKKGEDRVASFGDFVGELAAQAEARVARGEFAGWLDPVPNASGVTTNYKRRTYPSMAEAGGDYFVENLPDEQRDRARFLLPLIRRWMLRTERIALESIPVSEPRTQPRDRAPVPERVPTVASDWTQTGNSIAMHAQRNAIEQERRDLAQRRFAEQQAASAGPAAPDPGDVVSARFRIDAALREWNVMHPELSAELQAERRA